MSIVNRDSLCVVDSQKINKIKMLKITFLKCW